MVVRAKEGAAEEENAVGESTCFCDEFGYGLDSSVVSVLVFA